MAHKHGWEEYALQLAEQAALSRSEDPDTQVGACCLRKDGSIASLGYNGPPGGVNIDWTDRDAKLKRVIHAEVNCLKHVRPGEGEFIATTQSPCLSCLSVISAWGIKKLVFRHLYHRCDLDFLNIANELGITVRQLANATHTPATLYPIGDALTRLQPLIEQMAREKVLVTSLAPIAFLKKVV